MACLETGAEGMAAHDAARLATITQIANGTSLCRVLKKTSD